MDRRGKFIMAAFILVMAALLVWLLNTSEQNAMITLNIMWWSSVAVMLVIFIKWFTPRMKVSIIGGFIALVGIKVRLFNPEFGIPGEFIFIAGVIIATANFYMKGPFIPEDEKHEDPDDPEGGLSRILCK